METSKKGKCINFVNCPKADRKEIIELTFTEDFVCPECQQDLVEIEQKTVPWKKILIPAISILVIGGVIWGVFGYINIQKHKIKSVVEVVKTVTGDLSENVTKLLSDADSFFENKDYEKAIDAFKAILTLDPNNQHAKQSLLEIEKINVTPPNDKIVEKGKVKNKPEAPPVKINKTLNFPFGYYKGETVNSLRDGQGTMFFTERYLISPKDLKKRYAEAGDYVSGTWVEGNVVNGKLFNKAGEQKETLLIGH